MMHSKMDIHCGDDSPDPISKAAFDRMVIAAEEINQKLVDDLREEWRIRDIMREQLKESNAKLAKIQRILNK